MSDEQHENARGRMFDLVRTHFMCGDDIESMRTVDIGEAIKAVLLTSEMTTDGTVEAARAAINAFAEEHEPACVA